MKKILLPLVALMGLFLLVSCATQKGKKHQIKDRMLIGKITKYDLQQPPFLDWYKQNHDAYKLDSTLVQQLKKDLKNYNIEVFMGTWCGDSHRQVPAFYKVLEVTDFPQNQIKLYAVDRRKKTGLGVENGKDIQRVPTFIFYKNGVEVGRITEHPKNTLEQDISDIINASKN